MKLNSNTKEQIFKAFTAGESVFELDTANSGNDDVLIGTEEECITDIILHTEFDEMPVNWTLRKIDKEELEQHFPVDKTYYLISEKYVGPNEKDSCGNFYGDGTIMRIETIPGTKNMSGEECTDGWLGTTNDYSRDAHGEFETLEDAREAAHKLGYTQKCKKNSHDDEIIEEWISEADSRDKWDASDWFDGIGRDGVIDEYKITAKTTDSEIRSMVKKAEESARDDNTELFRTDEYFTEIRDSIKEEDEEDDDEE
jgi:hypothetical protein